MGGRRHRGPVSRSRPHPEIYGSIGRRLPKQELCDNRPPKGKFDLFATEGGTAAMCYIFDSLQQNFLLGKGDKIVLFAPVFTPYIEIPEQARYLFDVTEIHACKMTKDGYHTWQYKEEDLDILKDPSVKAAFIVNPSNPPSYGLTDGLWKRIVRYRTQ